MSTPRPALLWPLLIVATVAMSGCGSANGDGSADESGSLGDLTGSTYISSSVTKGGDDFPLVRGTHIRLQFLHRSLAADAGCNQLGGNAAYHDGVLDIEGPLSMTEMGCPEARMAQDQWLADLLAADPSVAVDGDTLTLTSGETVIEFVDDEVVNPDRPLVGPQWRLESIGDATSPDGAVSSVPDGVASTFSIKADGSVSATLPCNTGSGSATIDDGAIRFDVGFTMLPCRGDAADVESVVTTFLTGSTSYAVDADVLTLTKDGRALTFRAS